MNRIERHHNITVARPIDQVFPLFTPEGEILWVPGWNPDFIHPESGETCEGMVFRTGRDQDETLWSCIEWKPSDHRVRYARVTPSSRFGFVEVSCKQAGLALTDVSVSYTFTALTEQGKIDLANLTDDAFSQMIETWRVQIERWFEAAEENAS
ncbi:hypothetical protein XH88_09915 [Bradyrhizobium sp. CCBAU 51627]|nr:hypothetical protein [Bradyrhizobium sp. CCBAU 51627]